MVKTQLLFTCLDMGIAPNKPIGYTLDVTPR